MRGGDHDEVALAQHLVEPVGPPQGHARRGVGGARVDRQRPHAERQRPLGHFAADPAQADDAERAVGQRHCGAVRRVDLAGAAVAGQLARLAAQHLPVGL